MGDISQRPTDEEYIQQLEEFNRTLQLRLQEAIERAEKAEKELAKWEAGENDG